MKQQDKVTKISWKYLLGAFFVAYFIIFTFCCYFEIDIKEISGPAGKGLPPGTKPGIAQVYSLWEPWDKAVVPFYFTVQSNVFVFVYLTLRGFGIIDPRKNKHAKHFQLITATNIFVTFIIYWTILAPIDIIWHSPWHILDTFQMHLISPLILCVVFLKESWKNTRNKDNIQVKNIAVFLMWIFPLIWFAVAIILYYTTRKEISMKFKYNDGTWSPWFKYSFGIAVYPFLAFDISPVWLPILSLIGIMTIITITSYALIAISNRNSWIYKFIDKQKNRKINKENI